MGMRREGKDRCTSFYKVFLLYDFVQVFLDGKTQSQCSFHKYFIEFYIQHLELQSSMKIADFDLATKNDGK